ncbi:patatin-like phospholipase family protein [Nocardia vinacea]|uniref:patatin-like phospholipase family protein n=1 Tax=Nocardia vinacea TaxID=96468 RepID=UPI00341D0275
MAAAQAPPHVAPTSKTTRAEVTSSGVGSRASHIRALALVLGPGGVVGTAWLLGLAAGLREEGVELAEAETIVGTSAGSIVAALVARGSDLLDLADSVASRGEEPALITDAAVTSEVFAIMQDAADADPVQARQRAGRAALRANTSPAEARIERMAELVGTGPWPHQGLLIPTVDAESGMPRVWSVGDGVPVHLAVTASTAMPGLSAPIPISGRRYFDGAFRKGANADLTAAADTLLMIEPLGHVFHTPAPDGPTMVLRIGPDEASLTAFGNDLHDLARWPATFDAGMTQASTIADAVGTVWITR